MNVELSSRRIFFGLMAVSGFLVAMHCFGQISRLAFGHGRLLGLVPLFCLEDEFNVPTFWSSTLWLMAGFISGVITVCERRGGRAFSLYWGGIAILCCYFALDETVQLHERLGGVIVFMVAAQGEKTSPFLYYMWVVPGSLFALAVFGLYFRFLLALPRSVARLFVIAGGLFLSGAIGVELIEGRLDAAGAFMGPLYTVCVTFEEGLEMIGICVFVLALLRYLSTTHPRIELTVLDK